MSGQCTGWVLRHGPKDRAMRAVLVTIADAANRDGEHAHPGIAAMVDGSCYSRATVFRALDRLKEEGWVSVEAEGQGRFATVYTVHMRNVSPCDLSAEGKRLTGDEQTSHPADANVSSGATTPTYATDIPTEQRDESDDICDAAVDSRLRFKASQALATGGHLDDAIKLCEGFAISLRERAMRCPDGAEYTKAWIEPMDALLRLDGRDPETVARTIVWLHAGRDDVSAFWRTVVLSPLKLRLQWDKMAAQYRRKVDSGVEPGAIAADLAAARERRDARMADEQARREAGLR